MSADGQRLNDRRESLSPGVAASLSAAAISPSKLGPARHAGLEAAGRLGLDAERALETLAREDLKEG